MIEVGLTKRWSKLQTRHGESSTGSNFNEAVSADRGSFPAAAGPRSLNSLSLGDQEALCQFQSFSKE